MFGPKSFDEAKEQYNAVVPVVSKLHSIQQDVRPIGQRRRKWERIVKVSETCYGLSDGNYSDMWSTGFDKTYVNNMMPILWERREDGDYMRLRGVVEGHTSHGRVEFLHQYLPSHMSAHAKNGKLYIWWGGKAFYLPKTKYKWNHQTNTASEDDKMFLEFKHVGDNKFERVNLIVAASTRINIPAKKRLKPYIQSFFDWVCVMRNMMVCTHEAREEYVKQLHTWAYENKIDISNTFYRILPNTIDSTAMQQIIVDPAHPMRTAIGALLLYELDLVNWRGEPLDHKYPSEKEFKRRVAARYNVWVTKALNLYKQEEF